MNDNKLMMQISSAVLSNWSEFEQICIDNDLREYIDELWQDYDLNADGYIVRSEAHKFVQHLLRKATGDDNLYISQDISNTVFLRYDLDKNNRISKEDLYKILYSEMKQQYEQDQN